MLKLSTLKYIAIFAVSISNNLYAESTALCPDSMICGQSDGSNSTVGPCTPSSAIDENWQGSFMGLMYPLPRGQFKVTFVGAVWQATGATTCWYTNPENQEEALTRYMNPNNIDYAPAATPYWDALLAPSQSSCVSSRPADCGFVKLWGY